MAQRSSRRKVPVSPPKHRELLTPDAELVRMAAGSCVRELRHARNLTQEALADNAHIDRTFLSQIERGIRQPALGTLYRLARAFNLTATELVAHIDARLEKDAPRH